MCDLQVLFYQLSDQATYYGQSEGAFFQASRTVGLRQKFFEAFGVFSAGLSANNMGQTYGTLGRHMGHWAEIGDIGQT